MEEVEAVGEVEADRKLNSAMACGATMFFCSHTWSSHLELMGPVIIVFSKGVKCLKIEGGAKLHL